MWCLCLCDGLHLRCALLESGVQGDVGLCEVAPGRDACLRCCAGLQQAAGDWYVVRVDDLERCAGPHAYGWGAAAEESGGEDWSGHQESNPAQQLGRLPHDRYAMPALIH